MKRIRLTGILIILALGLLQASPIFAAASPVTFSWHTFYGSLMGDEGYALAVDGSGNIYLAGVSNETWNGPAGQLPLNPYLGGKAITVVKLSKLGNYLWHTFYGGGSIDIANDIAVDQSGNVVVTGESQFSWNGPGGTGPLNPYAGAFDIFVLRLSPAGAYVWHTFYGLSTNTDAGNGIAWDTNGDIVVAGKSNDPWKGPGTPNPVDPLHASSGSEEIVVLKLAGSGAYQWHTFYGSSGADKALDVTTDSSNKIYVTGSSSQTWNGPLGESPLDTFIAVDDILALNLGPAGNYAWHAFYGSDSLDEGRGIAVDGAGNIYVAGRSNNGWNYPNGPILPIHAYAGGDDVVVIKLSPSGLPAHPVSYSWHTFFGSETNNDFGYDIAIGNESILVSGWSDAAWEGPGNISPLNAYAGGRDILGLSLTNAGIYRWHTFFGSSGMDQGDGAAVDGNGNAILAGSSAATWNGTGGTTPKHTHSGGNDLVVIKVVQSVTNTFRSDGANDGWILESSETSSAGGTLNATNTTFNIGDDAADKQYRGILSFDTSSLADNAVLTRVTLKIKLQNTVGTNPFTTHGNLSVDIRRGAFSNNNVLQTSDFQGAATKSNIGSLSSAPVSGWYLKSWTGSIFSYINKTGVTQFRLRFNTGDNDDRAADYLKFYSGNAGVTGRPQLIITYYIP